MPAICLYVEDSDEAAVDRDRNSRSFCRNLDFLPLFAWLEDDLSFLNDGYDLSVPDKNCRRIRTRVGRKADSVPRS